MVLALESNFFREFRETGPRIVFLETVTTAAGLVERPISAFEGGSPESHQFVEAVTHARESARKAFHNTDRIAGIVSFAILPAQHSNGHFLNAPYDIAHSATEFASRRVFRGGRSLDIAVSGTKHRQKQGREKNTLHGSKSISTFRRELQEKNYVFFKFFYTWGGKI